MMNLSYTDDALREHGGLVHRAATILSTVAAKSPAKIVTAAAADERHSRRLVCVDRAASPSIERLSADQIKLRYADDDCEATLAALVACLTDRGDPIAVDPESLAILGLAARLADSNIPVLINGPTGTGKEVLARFIHSRSPRADKPFVAVNCAAMPETMLEALLFGHQKGAYTGAQNAGEGFFRAADGGTLLLDEIAEMPLALQAKLLRALQEGEVVPLGATRPIKVDVRIVACANRDLPIEVGEGRFRADLFYRLNVFPLSLRALADRPDDVAPLAFALAMRHCPGGAAVPWIADDALYALKSHNWPGNIRELENVMRRALLLANGEPAIALRHLHFDRPVQLVTRDDRPQQHPNPASEELAGEELSKVVQLSEARAIMATLRACGGSRLQAAKSLGISERTLRYRLARFRDAGHLIAGGMA